MGASGTASRAASRPDDGRRPGFSIFICPDGYLLRARLEAELARHAPAQGTWERHVFWGDEEPPPRFWELLRLQELFGACRVIVVRQAQLWPAAVWKKLSQALARPVERTWPILCLEGEWEKRRPKIPAYVSRQACVAFADKRGWTWRQEGLGEKDVARHVRGRAQALGLSFTPDALEQFCASVPPDGLAIENELGKLALLARDGAVTPAMTSTAAWSAESNVFDCIRRMEAGDLAGTWRELHRGDDGDKLLFSLLALVARDLRLCWGILAGEEPRLHPADAAFKKAFAARLGVGGVARGFCALADAEWQVKSGRLAPDQALERLAVELTGLAGVPGGAAAR